MTKQDEFIQSLDEELTPEQLNQIISGEYDEGDTGKEPESGGEPDASTAQGEGEPEGKAGKNGKEGDNEGGDAADPDKPDDKNTPDDPGSQTEPTGDELNSDNAVILAKDRKHTISYDKLVEARETAKAERAARQEAEAKTQAALQELESLKQAAQARAEAGESATTADRQVAAAEAAIAEGVDPELFGDFSEEQLAKGIETLVNARVSAQVEAALSQHLAPIQQRHQQTEAEAHYSAIYEAHPDADSLVESQELSDWIGAQPSFMQQACAHVLENGSTQEVIELFDRFKQETGATQEQNKAKTPDPEEIKAAAKAAAAKSQAKPPASLSDIPGGKAGAATRDDAMADMDAVSLLENMSEMSPEQIEAYLDRL